MVLVPYQYRPFSVRHRNIIRCILNRTIHTYPVQWCQVLILNWHVTDKFESTFTYSIRNLLMLECFHGNLHILSEKYTVSTEKGDSMFLQNAGIYVQVHTTWLTTRPTVTWRPQLSHSVTIESYRYTVHNGNVPLRVYKYLRTPAPEIKCSLLGIFFPRGKK
jgi:hypothetical protein